MSNLIIKHTMRFLLFILLQIFIFNNVLFLGYINPYIYLLFIILLPLNQSNKNSILMIALCTGLTIDTFQNSMGMHAFACVLISYLRTPLLQRLVPQIKNKHKQLLNSQLKNLEFRFA